MERRRVKKCLLIYKVLGRQEVKNANNSKI